MTDSCENGLTKLLNGRFHLFYCTRGRSRLEKKDEHIAAKGTSLGRPKNTSCYARLRIALDKLEHRIWWSWEGGLARGSIDGLGICLHGSKQGRAMLVSNTVLRELLLYML